MKLLIEIPLVVHGNPANSALVSESRGFPSLFHNKFGLIVLLVNFIILEVYWTF